MKNTFFAILGCFILLMGLACSSGAEGDPQVPAVFKIDSVVSVGGSNNIESDMLNSEDGVTADYATVTLSNAQKNTSTGSSTFNDVTINKYKVDFSRADGGTVFESFEKSLTATVHVNNTATISILIVRLEEKTKGLLAGRYDLWPLQLEAAITIYGQNGSGQNVTARGNIAVTIADYGDDQGNFVPSITAFIADKSKIVPGESLTLSWYLSGYVSRIILNPGNITLTPDYYPYGTYTIDSAQPAVYSIIAMGTYGSAYGEIDIEEVSDSPEISFFGVSPSAILSGESAIIEWSTLNTTSASIYPLIGDVTPAEGTVTVTPLETTTYTMVASNGLKTVSKELTLEVTDSQANVAPEIQEFFSNKAAVSQGDNITLTWYVAGAVDEVILNPGDIHLEGDSNIPYGTYAVTGVTPPATYTLTAVGPMGQSTENISVLAIEDVNGAPDINHFGVDKTSISEGDSVVLEWDISGATRAVIYPLVGDVNTDSGQLTVTPTETTTYTLMAFSGSLSSSETLTVEVAISGEDPNTEPDVQEFFSDKEGVEQGGSVTLTWYVAGNVDEIVINPGDIHLTGDNIAPYGNYTVTGVTPPTTFTITAMGPLGQSTDTLTVQTEDYLNNTPTINHFGSNVSEVAAGGTATLEWNISDATRAIIYPLIGEVDYQSGQLNVSPTITTTYTLMAFNGTVSATKTLTITVASGGSGGEPEVQEFFADKGEAMQGDSVTLAWYVDGGVDEIILNPGDIHLTAEGNTPYGTYTFTNVMPPVTYTLTAIGDLGQDTSTVAVELQTQSNNGPSITFFEAEPPTINEGESSVLEWRIENGSSAVLYPLIGSVSATTGTYTVTPDRTTTYTLLAQNDSGISIDTVTVTTLTSETSDPSIAFFVAGADEVAYGDVVHLYWAVDGAYTKIELFPYYNGGDDVLDVTSMTSVVSTPIYNDTTFVLSAFGNNKTVNATVSVTIAEAAKALNVTNFSHTDRNLVWNFSSSGNSQVKYSVDILDSEGITLTSNNGIIGEVQKNLNIGYFNHNSENKGFVVHSLFYDDKGNFTNDYRFVNDNSHHKNMIKSINVVGNEHKGQKLIVECLNVDVKQKVMITPLNNEADFKCYYMGNSKNFRISGNRTLVDTYDKVNNFELKAKLKTTVLVTVEDEEGNKDGRIFSFGK